jgi:Xaa-Pro aminopeptidase
MINRGFENTEFQTRTGLDETHPDRRHPDMGIMRELRMIKSDAEVDKIRHAWPIADTSFNAVRSFAKMAQKNHPPLPQN